MLKRSRPSRRHTASKDSAELSKLAKHLSQSCCRTEDRFWEQRLSKFIVQSLTDQDEASITSVLEQLYEQESIAYGPLIDLIESCAESQQIESQVPMDIVLIAVPILAWSRYQIPSGKVPSDQLDALRVHLHAHALAKDARLCLMDRLFSPEQLPQSYSETRQWLTRLTEPTTQGKNHSVDAGELAQTVHFLSDSRYLIGAIAVLKDAPLFRWQENDTDRDIDRDEVLRQWQKQGTEAIRPLLPACAFELLPPAAYHSSIREADRAARPYSLIAGIEFIKTVLGKSPSAFQATLGAYYNRQLEEYRIGLGFAESNDLIHGLVWPVIDPEDEAPEAIVAIEKLLRNAGITKVNRLSQQMPLEFCDDCGAPLFPNPEGESMHAELPDSASDIQSQQLH